MYLLIVTGLSGAGKSNALRYLEDLGYHCIDNLPMAMLESFVQLCNSAQPPIDRAAIVIDSRENVFHDDIEMYFTSLDSMDISYEILFLDCRDDVLCKRYNETRRRHPICSNLTEGIQAEREIIQPMRDRANYIIDTSDLKPLQLNKVLERTLRENGGHPFTLVLESFGYKRGLPIEADMVLDTRFSPNPFYEIELRPLSGLDEPVKAYVLQNSTVVNFLEHVEKMVVELIPQFAAQGKHRLMIAFGCTGGRHRSVCCAQHLYERLKSQYSCTIVHRDLVLEAREIEQRFETTGGR